jgi:hypothetical protein
VLESIDNTHGFKRILESIFSVFRVIPCASVVKN